MAFKLNKVFDPVVKLVKGKSKKKRTFRYEVWGNNGNISKHYTKKGAMKKLKAVGGRAYTIGGKFVAGSGSFGTSGSTGKKYGKRGLKKRVRRAYT